MFEPTVGTPFVEIFHELGAATGRPFVSSSTNLSSATVGTPGGVLSGSLSFKASGGVRKLTAEVCKGGHPQERTRSARVTRGTITASFDSIGKIRVSTNLNIRFRGGGVPNMISRVS